ncbi:MAG: sporulation protein [Lachnospiraceae bacterium]|nr:sporulation protein [Lachnospiraceae bacterium]
MATTKDSLQELMNQMEGFISTKTVVGEPIVMNDLTILPLVDVSLGVGGGSREKEKYGSLGGAMGAKMSPSAALVVKDGNVRMIGIRTQDTVSRVLDMVPDLVDKFTGKNKQDDETALRAVKEQEKEE